MAEIDARVVAKGITRATMTKVPSGARAELYPHHGGSQSSLLRCGANGEIQDADDDRSTKSGRHQVSLPSHLFGSAASM